MHILVVEDEVRLARHVSRALTNAGHDVKVVHDGEAALRDAKETRFELIVLDVMLPGIDPDGRRTLPPDADVRGRLGITQE